MHLRSILLLTSSVIIAFSLSLFFQSGQTVRSINIDQYQNLQYNEERSHSLAEFNQKILPLNLENLIQEIFLKNNLAREKTRIMEIGTGNGRVLMELKKKFPEIEFYGINKEKTHTFYRRESFILTALKFEIFNKKQIERIELPYIIFQDLDFGQKIPYGDDKFDIVFSQSTLQHIKYKFELFNEILRILKPQGVSIHSDVSGLVVYQKGVTLEIDDAVSELRKKGIDIHLLDDKSSLRFKKTNSQKRFELIPQFIIPENLDNIPAELRRPQMSYTL